MKNNFFLIFALCIFSKAFALDDLEINAKKISLDKKNEVTIFEDQVFIKDEEKNIIRSDYVIFDNKLKKLDIRGKVEIETNQGYFVQSEDVVLDKKEYFNFKKPTIITDIQKNRIYLDNFEYNIKKGV